MSQATRGVSRERAARAAFGPQRRHFVFQSCRPRIGCLRLGARLLQLDGEALGALTLALEHRPVGGCDVFEPRDLRLEGLGLRAFSSEVDTGSRKENASE